MSPLIALFASLQKRSVRIQYNIALFISKTHSIPKVLQVVVFFAEPCGSALAMFGILMLTCCSVRTPSTSSRQLVVVWLVFVMLLTAVFSSSIVAHITLPGFEPRLNTIRQLVEGGFYWYDMNYTAHGKQNVYFNLAVQYNSHHVLAPISIVSLYI